MTVPASTAALQADWRRRLRSTCKSLSDADLAEVEAHLQDSLEDLKARGLSEDEAFLIAARRLGRPEMIEAEFAQQNTRRYPKWSWFTVLSPTAFLLIVATRKFWASSLGNYILARHQISLESTYDGAWVRMWSDFILSVALPAWLLCLAIRPLRPASWRVLRWHLLIWAAYWNLALWLGWFYPLSFSWVVEALME